MHCDTGNGWLSVHRNTPYSNSARCRTFVQLMDARMNALSKQEPNMESTFTQHGGTEECGGYGKMHHHAAHVGCMCWLGAH
ncbi:hypothetical protein E2C01_009567 [Portunus trituberculatus]|uniref:Uncharacterized protein n=1 Tax=Portunus trituberculatus TaxID=210409 RepID=A0A5B7D649_PORTR|nr:hypothetical protein [Portunus trituberculatus]